MRAGLVRLVIGRGAKQLEELVSLVVIGATNYHRTLQYGLLRAPHAFVHRSHIEILRNAVGQIRRQKTGTR